MHSVAIKQTTDLMKRAIPLYFSTSLMIGGEEEPYVQGEEPRLLGSGWAYSLLLPTSKAFLSPSGNPGGERWARVLGTIFQRRPIRCRFQMRSRRATSALCEHRIPLYCFLTGVQCFFSGVRFNPAICRMPSQEARLSVSEIALFTIQVLTFFKSFTKASISA